jgi:LPXTG-motif cell wall-anchored protein
MTTAKIFGILVVLLFVMFLAACGRDDTEDRASAPPAPLNESVGAPSQPASPQPAAAPQDVQSVTPSSLPQTASEWTGYMILGLALVLASVALRYRGNSRTRFEKGGMK